MKLLLFDLLGPGKIHPRNARIFNAIIVFFIMLSIGAIIAQSFSSVYLSNKRFIDSLDAVIIVVFTIEYLIRLWVSDLNDPHLKPWRARLKYSVSMVALIDLLAVLPFYLPLIFPFNLMFLRVLRMIRIFRIFKLHRYSKAMGTILKVMHHRKEEILSSFFIMFIIIVISAIIMYDAEGHVQPEAFPNVVASFWWAVCTLTTVGYGDVYPVTPIGKIIASIISLVGIGVIALPTAIISSGFIEEVKLNEIRKHHHNHKGEYSGPFFDEAGNEVEVPQYCSQCGKKLFK